MQKSFDFETVQEDGPSCPRCAAPGVPNGPPIPVDTWNQELHRYEQNGFARWRCSKCGFKWLI